MDEININKIIRLSGIAAVIQVLCVIGLVIIGVIVGPEPESAREFFLA